MAIVTVGLNPAIDRVLECAGFHVGGHQQVREVARLAAGKGANVARAVAQLGMDSIATGFVGMNELEFFHEQLMECGPGRVLCHFVEVGGKTRENITILDTTAGLETHLRDRGFAVVEMEIELLEKRLVHDVRDGDLVVFAGSMCEGVSAERFAKLVGMARKAGALVVVDSSGEGLKASVRAGVWMIKPNVAELGELLGRELKNEPGELVEAARGLLGTVEVVLVSRGSEGALLVAKEGVWQARVPAGGKVVRTVGCGDHLVGGFVAATAGGSGLEGALRQGVAMGSARAASENLDEIEEGVLKEVMGRVSVEKVR